MPSMRLSACLPGVIAARGYGTALARLGAIGDARVDLGNQAARPARVCAGGGYGDRRPADGRCPEHFRPIGSPGWSQR